MGLVVEALEEQVAIVGKFYHVEEVGDCIGLVDAVDFVEVGF